MTTSALMQKRDALAAKWEAAPVTARAMLGAYVPPLLDLIAEIINRLEEIDHGRRS